MAEFFHWKVLIRVGFLFLLLLFVERSVKKRQYLFIIGFILMFLGHLLNNIVVFSNDNKMPVDGNEFAVIPNRIFYNYVAIDKETNIPFLSDIFIIRIVAGPLKSMFSIDLMVSVGDLIVVLGIIFVILGTVRYPVEKRRKAVKL